MHYVVVLFAMACSRPPDFQAFCEKAAPCEGGSVSSCMAEHRKLWDEQKDRGCGDEGAAAVECEIKYGRCEKAGTWSLFMPTDSCKPAVERLGDCLRANRK